MLTKSVSLENLKEEEEEREHGGHPSQEKVESGG